MNRLVPFLNPSSDQATTFDYTYVHMYILTGAHHQNLPENRSSRQQMEGAFLDEQYTQQPILIINHTISNFVHARIFASGPLPSCCLELTHIIAWRHSCHAKKAHMIQVYHERFCISLFKC
jgi:hypothetical protein